MENDNLNFDYVDKLLITKVIFRLANYITQNTLTDTSKCYWVYLQGILRENENCREYFLENEGISILYKFLCKCQEDPGKNKRLIKILLNVLSCFPEYVNIHKLMEDPEPSAKVHATLTSQKITFLSDEDNKESDNANDSKLNEISYSSNTEYCAILDLKKDVCLDKIITEPSIVDNTLCKRINILQEGTVGNGDITVTANHGGGKETNEPHQLTAEKVSTITMQQHVVSKKEKSCQTHIEDGKTTDSFFLAATIEPFKSNVTQFYSISEIDENEALHPINLSILPVTDNYATNNAAQKSTDKSLSTEHYQEFMTCTDTMHKVNRLEAIENAIINKSEKETNEANEHFNKTNNRSETINDNNKNVVMVRGKKRIKKLKKSKNAQPIDRLKIMEAENELKVELKQMILEQLREQEHQPTQQPKRWKFLF